MRRLLVLAGCGLLLASCASDSKSPPDDGLKLHVPSPAWEDQVIYFVMTDRFADGDPGNDDQGAGEYDPANLAKYSGGDLQGVIDKLDYIQGLGATAVWITPPVANMWWDPLQEFGGFHGYWARHLTKVDEHLGTLETYQRLSHELHKRGMYLVQDVVPNHMGNFFTWSEYDPTDPTKGFVRNTGAVPGDAPEQPPFDQVDVGNPAQRAAAIYHWTPAIQDFGDPVQEKDWQISDLDDLNSENPVVRKALRASYGYWIREVGVDAFRVDTAKFVPHDFWNDFMTSSDPGAPGMSTVAQATGRDDFLAFGEVFEVSEPGSDTAEKELSSFLGTPAKPELPSVLQFPLYEEIGRVFAEGKPTRYLSYRLERFMDPGLFPDPRRIPLFIDNHDVRRFLSLGSLDAFKQALTLLMTLPGIPVIYYGTEQAFTETRAAMFKGGYQSGDTDHFDDQALYYKRIAKLTGIRKANPVFTQGTLGVLYDNAAGAGPFAFVREYQGEKALVIFNTADEPVLAAHLPTGLPPGTVLEMLHAEKEPPAPEVGLGGLYTAVLPARAVLVARATTDIVAPEQPAATIEVTTAIEGQTFTEDVTIEGQVTPAATKVQLVLDSYVGRATDITTAEDGTFSVLLPVSLFPVGKQDHSLVLWAPEAKVASDTFDFVTNVVFDGAAVLVEDPAGDDKGPSGTYTYPQDTTFGRQMDMTSIVVEAGPTTLTLKITLADWSTVWDPPNKFDHVSFNIYFDIPGRDGLTLLPKINGTAPAGFAWDLTNFVFGWKNAMHGTTGASATEWGDPVGGAPAIIAQAGTRTVVLQYDRNAMGIEKWEGVKIYVTTWDFDGIGNEYREISPEGGQWGMGGGAPADPYIMDDAAPIVVPPLP